MACFDRERVIVLAAGEGRRMGGPKALLDVDGQPLWRLQRERLESIRISAVWVVSEAVKNTFVDSGAGPGELVTADSSAPMFSSLIAGLHALPIDSLDGVFILPVDVPAPPAVVWRALQDGASPTVPTNQGVRGHPVRLPTGSIRERVFEADSIRDLRLDHLLEDDSVTIEVDDPSVLVNLNRPADVEVWKRSP